MVIPIGDSITLYSGIGAETVTDLSQPSGFSVSINSRTMTISDVTLLHENGVDKAHFCDSIGFIEVLQFLQADTMVTMYTTGLVVDGHFGTWHIINTQKINGQEFYPMEHDEFGDEATNIIVDGTGKVVAEDVWNGFSSEILGMIIKEQGLLSDPTHIRNRSKLYFRSRGALRRKLQHDRWLHRYPEQTETGR